VTLDEVERLSAPDRLANVRLGGIGIAHAQILRDGPVEQERLLENHTDVATKPCELHVSDIAAVDSYRPGLRVIDAIEERERRGFAGAGRADQRDGFAGIGGESDPGLGSMPASKPVQDSAAA
jgi:hypothetical protein